MKVSDSAFGVAFMLFAVVVFWSARQLPAIPGQNVGPAAFPSLLAILLMFCGGLLTVRGLARWRTEPLVSLDPWTRSWPHLRNFLLIIVALVFYVLASEVLGFFLCAFLILMTLFLSLRVTWWKAGVVSVGAVLVVHALFYKLLKVPLPWGPVPVLW